MQDRLDSRYHIFIASDVYSNFDATPGHQVNSADIPSDDRLAGGLPWELHLTMSTCVMLLRNLHFSEGLVNGAIGTVH